jgi:hypothetical protein
MDQAVLLSQTQADGNKHQQYPYFNYTCCQHHTLEQAFFHVFVGWSVLQRNPTVQHNLFYFTTTKYLFV